MCLVHNHIQNCLWYGFLFNFPIFNWIIFLLVLILLFFHLLGIILIFDLNILYLCLCIFGLVFMFCITFLAIFSGSLLFVGFMWHLLCILVWCCNRLQRGYYMQSFNFLSFISWNMLQYHLLVFYLVLWMWIVFICRIMF